MKLKNEYVRLFQTGGEMPTEQPGAPAQGAQESPAPEGGGDPVQAIVQVVMQLGEAAAQAVQSQDPNAMAQVCQSMAQFAGDLAQQMGGGQTPVFKKGGKVVRQKMNPQMKKCGGKMK